MAMMDWNRMNEKGYFEDIKLVDADMKLHQMPLHKLALDYVIGSDLIW